MDQRAVHLYLHLHLTEEGTTLLAKAPRPAQGTLSEALECLGDNHLICLEDGLTQLISSMKVKDEEAALVPLPME